MGPGPALLTMLLLLLLATAGRTSAAGITMDVGLCPLITGGDCPDPRIRFFLYTRLNPNTPERIDYGPDTSNLTRSFFNASHPTKLLVHGYNADMFVFSSAKKEYLTRGAYNVLLMDWAQLSDGPCYITAAHNARFAGRCAAEMVLRAREAGAVDLHLVGFSLGAHVPAFAANHLRPYLLPRITGLDPAMPLFVTPDKDQKLDAGDAQFVDVMHTNAFMQGKSEQCGHIDFYMNGGVTQPGCFADSGCSHERALLYFTESIRSKAGFWAWPCGSIMHYVLGLCPPRGTARRAGEDVDKLGSGFYVTTTNSEPPYAKGPWKLGPAELLRSSALRSTGDALLKGPRGPL